MKHLHGQFKSNNDTIYDIHIYNDAASNGEKIIGNDTVFFSSEPCIITTNCDNLFTHIIKKSATISLLSKEMLTDYIFATNQDSVRVEIYKGNGLIFSGYVEPNIYSQPYANEWDEIQINCLDKLSVLQYRHITDDYDNYKITASITTFKSLLTSILNDGGKLYYDGSKTLSNGLNVFDNISISELVFLGDNEDDFMNNEEILFEILKYLNLHIIQEGNDYYIFDWDSQGTNKKWIDLSTNLQTNSIGSNTHINKEDYSSDGTNITIDDVYNQIQVKCNIEKMETIIESPLDSTTSLYKNKQPYMTEYISEGEGTSAFRSFYQMMIGDKTDYDGAKQFDWYMQYKINPNWKFYFDHSEPTAEQDTNGEYINQWKLPKALKDNQIYPAILSMGYIESSPSLSDNAPINKIDMNDYLFISVNGNEDDTENGHSPADNTLYNRQPIIEYAGNNSGGSYSPSDDGTINYLVFSGKMLIQPIAKESDVYSELKRYANIGYEYFYNRYYHSTVPSDNNEDGRYYARKFYNQEYVNGDSDSYLVGETSLQPWTKDKANHLYEYNYSADGDDTDKYSKLPVLECELIIGDKRLIETNIDIYGNSTFEWVTVGQEPTIDGYKKTTFSLGVNPKLNDYIIGDEFEIQNTIDYKMNVDARGTAIPIKKSDALNGKVTFRILGPVNTLWNDIVRRHPSFWRHTSYSSEAKFILAHTENIIIKDFECKIYSNNDGYITDSDNDLIYLSDEQHNYIKIKDDIEFNINTALTSEEAFKIGLSNSVNISSAIAPSGFPLDKIKYGNDIAKAEELYVDYYYNKYNNPKIILETDVMGDDKSYFNTYSVNYLNGTFNILAKEQNLKDNHVHLKLRQK